MIMSCSYCQGRLVRFKDVNGVLWQKCVDCGVQVVIEVKKGVENVKPIEH